MSKLANMRAPQASNTKADAVTPLPLKQMFALTIVLMTESLCTTMLLPFVPRLIAYLKHISVEEAGYYSGMVVGLFMLGQVVSGKLWGYLSDKYGRKLPLTTGLVAAAFAMLLFGYTTSFVACCILRFLHGFFNGNTLVAKTMIADITDRTNEAKGFALVSITWGVGTLFGPFLGGFLYNPSAKSYLQWLAGGSLKSFFETRPAFLPGFVIFLYTIFALIACTFFLDETNEHCVSVLDSTVGRKLSALKTLFRKTPEIQGSAGVVVLADSDVSQVIAARASAPGKASASSENGTPVIALPAVHRQKLTYIEALRIDALRNVILFFMLLAASDMTFGQILPLWGNASHDVNGMGLTENTVALVILSLSAPTVIANLYFHRVCAFFDGCYMLLWRKSLVLCTACALIVPLGSQMGGAGLYLVVFLGMVRQVGLSWCYSLLHMLTAKAAPLGCVGAVYGISQSFASATRCVVPFVVSPLFAWSLSDGHVFPFNYYLLFLISAVPAGVSITMSFYVQITRAASELKLDVDTMTERIEVGDAEDTYSPRVSGSRRESEDPSLIASFCNDPLTDPFVDMAEMEKENVQGATELRTQAVTLASTTKVERTSLQTPFMEEDRRNSPEFDEELPPDSPSVGIR